MAGSLTDRTRRGGRVRARATRALALAVSVTLGACACQRATDAGETTPGAGARDEPAAPPVAADEPGPTAVQASGVPPELLTTALEDAATRTRAAVADIEVVTAEAVTWSDGAAGCPTPGQMYTQALVPGYRIVLRAFGELLNYHAGSSGGPKFCPAGQVTPPEPGGTADVR